MSTITAKELRDNLGEIAKRVQRGEHIKVTYRNKLIFNLTPEKPKTKSRLSGMQAMLTAPEKPSPFDPNKPVKALYHEHLQKKYGSK